MRVFVAGLTGESALLREQLLAHPSQSAGVEFTSVQLPGVDRSDYLAIHPKSKSEGFFMTPGIRARGADQRAAVLPLDYTGLVRYLLEVPAFDAAVGQFTPPDAGGWCSPGLCADFTPLVWPRAKRRVGHLNPHLPRFESSFRVHVSEFDAFVEASAPLLAVPAPPSNSVSEAIGRHAADLIRDGDTLQFGIGSVPPQVARALHSHRRLRIHSGMVSALLETLWESGSLDRDARIVTGVLLGDDHFYRYAEALGRIFLDDVRQTHGLHVMSNIPRFVAINGAVEVDLLGQVNSERSDGSIQAGAGGLPAYAQASQLAPEGRLLICLPAAAKSGKLSRIVPCLSANSLCTVPRHLTDAVVTEFGVAELRGLSVDRRAEALMAIAHPEHRSGLSKSWEEMRKRL
ncbi:acetyl-CoA hydrolase/transferase family protein [Variovorax sp. WS11]|uniref:acetyl-CoA hydrolase/transferase family protein n=1 Tax=Variovorax sp. WS11 TaxID=1105204 RepID=UPI0013DA9E06|nr:acetyl-CoA hydrolase/transferase C-terminal domain-containing protein [Variovorax sp. WS11]NDZ18787.1 acetyl-CoA hydrolase [Variovorax sp. WS11]